MRKGAQAFTLIELIVVLGGLGLLAALLVPAFGIALERTRSTKCKANLGAMVKAAQIYLAEHDGYFPPALISNGEVSQGWDFIITGSGDNLEVRPGLLWESYGANQVLQCPSFRGSDQWQGEDHTGYNYNASYLGGMFMGFMDFVLLDTTSASIASVRSPSQTAIFGDGEWAGGANKFMRSPSGGTLDDGFSGRSAGTQGFRHGGKTNVAFVDGHVESLIPPPDSMPGLALNTGFLSSDNSLYDLY